MLVKDKKINLWIGKLYEVRFPITGRLDLFVFIFLLLLLLFIKRGLGFGNISPFMQDSKFPFNWQFKSELSN